MKKKIFNTIFLLTFIIGLALPALAGMGSDSYHISTLVISGGGVSMGSDSYRTDATLGQPSQLMDPYDPLSSSNYYLYPGFWYTVEVEEVIEGMLDSDNDGIPDDGDDSGVPGDNPCTGEEMINCDDNCPDDYNPNQEDTYPPGGNGIGDTCDCEGNFDCDGDVDAGDVDSFLTDFGRFEFNNPCVSGNPCNGDFTCDGDVDAGDVEIFLEDFGRFQFNNPCPACEVEDWCSY